MDSKLPKRIGNLINGLSYLNSKLSAKIAYYLFTTPRKGRYSNKQLAQLKGSTLSILKYSNHDVATYY